MKRLAFANVDASSIITDDVSGVSSIFVRENQDNYKFSVDELLYWKVCLVNQNVNKQAIKGRAIK